MAGEWAPTGSSEPEQCPASGFTCPGRSADDVLADVVVDIQALAAGKQVVRSEPDLAGLGGDHVAEEASREADMYVYAFVATCIYVIASHIPPGLGP